MNSFSGTVRVMLLEIHFHGLYCIASEWILVVFAVASIGLIFALAFKSKEYPTNFILLAAFVSIVLRTYNCAIIAIKQCDECHVDHEVQFICLYLTLNHCFYCAPEIPGIGRRTWYVEVVQLIFSLLPTTLIKSESEY